MTRLLKLGGGSTFVFLVVLLLAGCESFPPSPDPNVRYVAFGDSTTDGPADKQYVDFLPDLLHENANAFANEGNSGETSAEGLARLRTIFTQKRYPNATTLIYWEGGNDLSEFIQQNDPLLLSSPAGPDFALETKLQTALDETQATIAEAIMEARSNGLTVYVATYAPLGPGIQSCNALLFDLLFPAQATNGNAYLDELNRRLVQVAATNGAILVDIAAIGDELRSSSSNYENCNHLSEQGNERAAREFAAALRP